MIHKVIVSYPYLKHGAHFELTPHQRMKINSYFSLRQDTDRVSWKSDAHLMVLCKVALWIDFDVKLYRGEPILIAVCCKAAKRFSKYLTEEYIDNYHEDHCLKFHITHYQDLL